MRLHRRERLESTIREELAIMFVRDIELPGYLATITEVHVVEDFSRAVVRVSFLPSKVEEKPFAMLKKALPGFERALWKKLGIRPMPHLALEIDHGLENAASVERALIEDERKETK